MKTSGYNTEFIRKVMVAGIKRYEKKLKKQQAGSNVNYAPLHKNRSVNAAKRMEIKMMVQEGKCKRD